MTIHRERQQLPERGISCYRSTMKVQMSAEPTLGWWCCQPSMAVMCSIRSEVLNRCTISTIQLKTSADRESEAFKTISWGSDYEGSESVDTQSSASTEAGELSETSEDHAFVVSDGEPSSSASSALSLLVADHLPSVEQDGLFVNEVGHRWPVGWWMRMAIWSSSTWSSGALGRSACLRVAESSNSDSLLLCGRKVLIWDLHTRRGHGGSEVCRGLSTCRQSSNGLDSEPSE
ncbi:hypothetical protein N7540_011196 [Penicillium herquei]|nr:hypothetical protein N7540_011196 [Penicillium herquei]